MTPLPMQSSRRLASERLAKLLATLCGSSVAIGLSLSLPAAAAAPHAAADRFFAQHCLRCHDGQTQEGQFRIDDLSRDFTSLAAA